MTAASVRAQLPVEVLSSTSRRQCFSRCAAGRLFQSRLVGPRSGRGVGGFAAPGRWFGRRSPGRQRIALVGQVGAPRGPGLALRAAAGRTLGQGQDRVHAQPSPPQASASSGRCSTMALAPRRDGAPALGSRELPHRLARLERSEPDLPEAVADRRSLFSELRSPPLVRSRSSRRPAWPNSTARRRTRSTNSCWRAHSSVLTAPFHGKWSVRTPLKSAPPRLGNSVLLPRRSRRRAWQGRP